MGIRVVAVAGPGECGEVTVGVRVVVVVVGVIASSPCSVSAGLLIEATRSSMAVPVVAPAAQTACCTAAPRTLQAENKSSQPRVR